MIDHIIVGIYLVITLAIGIYASRDVKSIKDFAIGRRDFSTLVLVAAVFASVVDASCTVGLAGNTFSVGPILILAYTGVSLSRFILAYFIAPKMGPYMDLISSGDIFERIYGSRAKTLIGISTLIESILMAGSQVLAISHVLTYFFNISPRIATIGGAAVIVFYSFKGGIRSVTATDVFQFAIMLIAIPIVCGIGIAKIGGLSYFWSFIKSKGLFLQEASVNDYGKHAAIFVSLALPCLYPMCVQRMLMAKNTSQIKRTFIINGVLTIPFYCITGLVGIVALVLIPNIDANYAFPALIDQILPIGIKGFVVAGLLAIFMSTVDSILNVGSIAAAHDLVGSIVKTSLTTKTELRLIKMASIIISIGAIFIALHFTNVLDVMFFVMVVGNSVFFPGYLLGLTNLHAGVRAFWLGVLAGAFTAVFCLLVLGMYPLYVMLIAIAANCAVHAFFHGKRRCAGKVPTRFAEIVKRNETQHSYKWIKNVEYCKIFSACIIAVSIFPFFIIGNAHGSHFGLMFLIVNAVNAVLSFFMLFHELWWRRCFRYFESLWLLSLFLAFPMQSLCMLNMESFSLPWLLDLAVAIPILTIVTNLAVSILYSLLVIIGVATFFTLGTATPLDVLDKFGYCSLFLHLVMLSICLFLFRKRDVAACRFASSTLIHETGRSITAILSMSEYLHERLPLLLNGYLRVGNNLADRTLTKHELANINRIPIEMRKACLMAKSIARSMALRIDSLVKEKPLLEICSIGECVREALEHPAINDYIKDVITVHDKEDFKLLADRSLLTQALVNIFENACHATKSKDHPQIHVAIENRTITIEDNGVGISQANLPSIFDEFFSTKSSNGQGLAFCKSVIAEHGGSIDCESVMGCFSRFQLRFPITEVVDV